MSIDHYSEVRAIQPVIYALESLSVGGRARVLAFVEGYLDEMDAKQETEREAVDLTPAICTEAA